MRFLYHISAVFFICIILFSCTKDAPVVNNPEEILSLYKLEKFQFQNRSFIKIGSDVYNFIIIFELEDDLKDHNFEASLEMFPNVITDEYGGYWNTFGDCISGPLAGRKLKATNSTFAYWFTWINLFSKYSLNEVVSENASYPLDNPLWNIPTTFVNEGAKFDAIPSIDNPVFDEISFKESLIDYNFLNEEDQVIVASNNGETKVYPVKILDHHEIVNDNLGGEKLVISYAPYTGSPAVHKSQYKNVNYSFGVSGKVYMNNMLLFDRETLTFWSQLLNRAVNGPLLDAALEPVSFILVDWSIWKNAADEYTILSEEQGFNKDYRTPKFDNYIANDTFLPFDVPNKDNSHLNKSVFYGLGLGDEVLLFDKP